MFLEYLLVIYKSNELVLADDMAVGVTNHIILLPPGDYTITLPVAVGAKPASIKVSLDATSVVRPKVISFT